MGDDRVVARRVLDGAAVGQAQTVGIDADAVDVGLGRQDGVVECQHTGAMAAGVAGLHRVGADFQSELRSTAHVHGFAEVDADGHHVIRVQGVVLDAQCTADFHLGDGGHYRVHQVAGVVGHGRKTSL